ncbi:MAG: asparagine synthase (glutamine-hydrolyzing) [Planctomycetota bacterium]
MCGFAGQWLTAGRADIEAAATMAARLAHRGPDQEGRFVSADGRCAIGFRRLCVIDPDGSRQPMTHPDVPVTLAFNGELYNFRALRSELERQGERFRTAGDTEVLLAMYVRHGLAMLDRLEGMFAAAIYDGRAGCLHLVRDRLGLKPLWYVVASDRVVFASEAKALRAHPAVATSVDPTSLVHYLTIGYIPAPQSIWQGVRKLPPACHLTFGDGGAAEPQRWWSPPAQTATVADDQAVEAVREVVRSAVAKRLVSDVPIGALLSGGLDSSIVVAAMCDALGDPAAVRTFSAGFTEQRFDERPFAREVAEHLGTTHTELLIEADAATLLDDLLAQYDEPFGDSSALPLWMLSRAVRQRVTVALVGDGGDEAFAGYDRHRAMWLAEHIAPLKAMVMTAGGMLVDTFAPRDEKNPLRRFARFAAGLDAPPALRYESYRALFTAAALDDLVTDDLAAAADPRAGQRWFETLFTAADCDTDLLAAQRHDVLTYLPDDLLVKADIASMAWGLELRSPFLDHHVIELGLSLPDTLKVDRRRGKRILVRAFGDRLPAGVFERPKTGFGVPLDAWLAGPLLGTLKETLLDQSFIDAGWVKRSALERLIDQHARGKADHRHRLWALLCLGRWWAMGSATA